MRTDWRVSAIRSTIIWVWGGALICGSGALVLTMLGPKIGIIGFGARNCLPQAAPDALRDAEEILRASRREGDAGRPEAGLQELSKLGEDLEQWPGDLRGAVCLEKARLIDLVSWTAEERDKTRVYREQRDGMLAQAKVWAEKYGEQREIVLSYVQLNGEIYRWTDTALDAIEESLVEGRQGRPEMGIRRLSQNGAKVGDWPKCFRLQYCLAKALLLDEIIKVEPSEDKRAALREERKRMLAEAEKYYRANGKMGFEWEVYIASLARVYKESDRIRGER